MVKEVVSFLNLKKGSVVLDATLGGGGHAGEILKQISPGGKLIGVDADPEAISRSETALDDHRESFRLINDNFRNIDDILVREGVKNLDGILFDVGISSYQIDDASRGFSIKKDAPLDMRMDPRIEISAYDIVNRLKEKELADVISKFGEERFARKIARRIAEERSKKPIATTFELADIIHRVAGYKSYKTRIDPATRTFQALRIAVNDELNALEAALKKAVGWLKLGARICVISFHSLEDRIAKNTFREYSKLGVLKIITKKPAIPSHEEMALNPRSRSAKLRVAERV